MPLDPQVAPVVRAFQRSSDVLRDRVVAFVSRTWLGLDNYRDADIEAFVEAVKRVVTAGQVQMAAMTDAYLAAVEQAALGVPVQPLGVPADVVATETMRGVTDDELWRRPGLTVWTSLDRDESLTDAVTNGLGRAAAIAATNLQLAKTHAARSVLTRKSNVTGYRRVPRGASSCDLCRTATHRYVKSELQPMHPGCDCGVMPIFGKRDPGPVVESDQPEDIVAEHRHGELGPVLGVAGQHFTGPSAIPT